MDTLLGVQPHIFCIHHTDNRTRKKRLLRRFDQLGLTVEWIETYHPSERASWDHDGLSGGSIGETSCALKHRDALRRQVARRLPLAVVLEDDIDLPKTFPTDLERYLAEMAELPGDIMMIGTCLNMHIPATEPERTVYLAPEGYTRCTHAYAVTLAAAETIAPALDHMPKGIGHDLNDVVRSRGLRMCWVEPGLQQLTQTGDMLSSIGERRSTRDRLRVARKRLTTLGRRR